MACVHLQELYRLCQEHEMKFSSTDLVRIVCKECESEEVCPSALTEIQADSDSSDTSADQDN